MSTVQRLPNDALSLASIIITPELNNRRPRPPNHAAVNDALVRLMKSMANSPDSILQLLVETALSLCQAHSAGISLLENEDGREIFRWHAVAGEYAPHLWGTTPREFSPCGTVLDTDRVQLMSNLDRHFGYFTQVEPRIREALLIPFHVDGKAVGTIWVISHTQSRAFDAEDARVMSILGEFAAAAYQVVRSLKALTNAQVELKFVNAELEQFALTVSHDLQEPLRSVTAFTQLLHQKIHGQLDAGAEKLFSVITDGALRMRRLIDDLLEYMRLRHEGEAAFYPTDLGDVLSDALANVQSMIDSEHASITFDPLPTVAGNRAQLLLLFQNLISNAIKYRRKEESPQIHIGAKLGEDYWLLSVRDNGEGFSKEYAETIFAAFKRLHGREISGSGLGLALSQEVVQRHGGKIHATSIPGQGSTFSFTLPVSKPHEECSTNTDPPSLADQKA
jgi:signal transduction histidine kinase